MLTWLLAADQVHSLPKPEGTVAEKVLEQTATQPTAPFKTQYPPDNERLLIPQAKPVSWQIAHGLQEALKLTSSNRNTV